MAKKIICLALFLGMIAGCVTSESSVIPGSSVRQGKELTSVGAAENLGPKNDMVFKPADVEEALPAMRDLPIPEPLKKKSPPRRYTGIIKNKTKYEVSVPAGESGGTLIIPAQGFIEYSAWERRFDLTAYYDGKPFYCMKIFANPKSYPFMCKKYDFMIEIVKAEPIPKKKRLKRRKRPGGVEALG